MTPADKTEVPAWIRDAAEEIHPFAKCLSAEDRDFQATVEVNDHIAEEQERFIAIIARHAPKDSWQPISTAPKDGMRMLCSYKGQRPFIGRWNANTEVWVDDTDSWRDATHWQPLPAAPADKQEGAGTL